MKQYYFMGGKGSERMKQYDVVVFKENHKWCGGLGYIREINGKRIMVGVPMPQQGTAYIFCTEDDIKRIGEYPFVEADDE